MLGPPKLAWRPRFFFLSAGLHRLHHRSLFIGSGRARRVGGTLGDCSNQSQLFQLRLQVLAEVLDGVHLRTLINQQFLAHS